MVTIFDCVDYFEDSEVFFLNVSDAREIPESKEMVFETRYKIDETKLNKFDCQKLE